MGKMRSGKTTDLQSGLRATQHGQSGSNTDPVRKRRQLVADLCKLLGPEGTINRPAPKSQPQPEHPVQQLPSLSPRTRQTLERLLAGDSEKQIATRLGVSRHTVHVYVKAIYKGFNVCSRGELLARFVQSPGPLDRK